MAFRVLLDTCVLAPSELSNLLLTLAEHGLFTPLWSEDILVELERTLVRKLGVDPAKATRRIASMREAFPAAMVTGYADLIPAMRNHKKDRHVLAAAVRGNAEVIVTNNLKDFPDAAANAYGVEIRHPDPFLTDHVDLNSTATTKAIEAVTSRYKTPAFDSVELMRRLRATVPNFAQMIGTRLLLGESLAMTPALFVQSPDSAAVQSIAPTGDLDVTRPENVGFHWWAAASDLPELRPLFESLCVEPKDWRDDRALASLLEGCSLATGVERAIEAPDRMAFMKLVGEFSTGVQVFEAGVVNGPLRVMTLVSDGTQWRVFALSLHYLTAADVFDNWSYRRP